MKPFPLEEFLALDWSDSLRGKLRALSDQEDLYCLAAWYNAGKLSCSAFTAKPDEWPPHTAAVWLKEPTASRTMRGVFRVQQDGLSIPAAAKELDISQAAIRRAIKHREGRKICPSCNQVIRACA